MFSFIIFLQCSVLFSEFFTVSANKKDVWFQHRLMPGVEYYVSSQKMSNSDAGSFCETNGAHLTSITSKNENQLVSRILANLRMRDKVWIGALRNLSGSQIKPFSWTWQDGSPFTIFQDYTSCVRGKNCLWREYVLSKPALDGPNNERGSEYCIATVAVAYSISSKPSKAKLGPWRDEQCKLTYPFVCKRQLQTTTSPVSIPAHCSLSLVAQRPSIQARFSDSANGECSWTITVPPGEVPSIAVTSFNISLPFTFFSIFDGPSKQSPLLLYASGHINLDLPPITGSNQYIIIVFQCDSSLLSTGISAFVTALSESNARPINSPLCSTPIFIGDSGSVISTNPGSSEYSSSQTCNWYIAAPPGYVPSLQFSSFDTEYGADVFSAYDGLSLTSSPLLLQASGQHVNILDVTATSDQMRVTFNSDALNTFAGVTATVLFVPRINPPTYCTGPTLIDQADATVSTLTLNGHYPGNLKCGWTIQAANGFVPTLTILSFSTEELDFVSVYDGVSLASPMLLHTSGAITPTPITASGQFLTVTFVSGASSGAGGAAGVQAIVTWTPAPTPTDNTTSPGVLCNGIDSITTGTSFSTNPGLPAYANNQQCAWLVSAPVGSIVKLTFTSFDTESIYDMLEIFDGPATTSPCIASLSGPAIPNSIFSSGQHMTIAFTTDASILGAGITASIQFISFSTIPPTESAARKFTSSSADVRTTVPGTDGALPIFATGTESPGPTPQDSFTPLPGTS